MKTSDFDFELPPELIASHPLPERDASRMLVVGFPGCDSSSITPQTGYPLTLRTGSPLARGVANGRGVDNKLPSNQKLKARARELRKAGSLPEALLWNEIKNKKINGLNFNRQTVIGNYIVDFYCPSNNIVIEIDDNASHDSKGEYDVKRDEYLKTLGLTVIRFSAKDILKDISAVIEYLERHPAALRHPSCQRGTSSVQDKHVRDFLDYLRPGDVVVFNNSRVIPARFNATDKNGHIYEITLHTSVTPSQDGGQCAAGNMNQWYGLAKKFNKLNIGDELTLDDNETKIRILDKDNDSGLKIEFILSSTLNPQPSSLFAVLERVGKMPLPPYMKRDGTDDDSERYQTVYSEPVGSMAAPTAGLHFTDELLSQIESRGAKIVNITLHVGAGTWMPVKTEDLSAHKMHSEWGCISEPQAAAINAAKRVIAVGTTSLRLLESAATYTGIKPFCASTEKFPSTGGVPSEYEAGRVRPFCASTDIFITPGYKFKVVDVLLTNFHLPKSTLFMLVSAFAGVDEMRSAYKHAVDEQYRFFSYGDCCLLFKKD